MARKLGSKDKTKRKSRSLLVKSALLGGSTALGGYIGGRNSKLNALSKYYKKRVDPSDYENSESVLRQKTKESLNELEDAVKKPFKFNHLNSEPETKRVADSINNYLDKASYKLNRHQVKLNNKLNKIRNVSIGKGALIGLGVGTALLGANELRKRMSKKK
jgi:CHASE3 domain sensor protein